RLLIATLCIALNGSLATVFAQQSVASATLSGRVEDADGAAIAGASVSAINVEQEQTVETTSDDKGRYRFSYLPVGNYMLKVEMKGFATVETRLALTVGQSLDIPIKLAVRGAAETVNVSQSPPLVETVRTQVTETVAPQEIDALPLNGRNYLDLAALTPAVTRTNPVSNQRFPETSAVPGTGLSIMGQRHINNGFIVDGLSANDDAADLAGAFYSQEVIREFQVITSGGIAEFGRASGGYVNIVTQSGANDYRGRLYGFLRNQRFDARNTLATSKDPLTQAQYGVSLGGPIKHNRAFFFTNFEQTRLNNTTIITIDPANVAAVNNQLDLIDYRGQHITTGITPTGFDTTNFLVRADYRINDKHLLMARYNLYDIFSINARNVGGLNSISRGTALDDRDQTIALSEVATINDRLINEARFQFTRSRLGAPVNDETGPAINIAGVANIGTATFSPTRRDLDTYEVVDNLSAQRGAHSLKAGADFLINRVDITFPGALQGVYTFSSLDNFRAGRYVTFQQAFGEISQFQNNPNIGFFIQDEWKPKANLTINAGLRYDAQFLPDPIETDSNNFAPRIGIAYAPGDRKTVVRASYGIYFDRLPLRATSNALQRDGSKYKTAVLSFGQPGAPAFPNVLAAFPANVLVSITTIDPRIKNAYSQQASLQVERELSSAMSVSIGYLHVRGLHIILSRNVNVPRFPASAGVPNLGRPDPRFANIGRFESSGDSYYNGMIFSFKRRFQNWAEARVSYTYSKAIDDAGNAFFFTPQDNSNLRDDRGLADNDQRHRLSLSGWFQSPHATKDDSLLRHALSDFQLSYIFQYGSALPFNILLGADRNFDTSVNDRPVGVARNAGKGFDFKSLDLRLSRRFNLTERVSMEAMIEGFNVLNRTNFQLPNATIGTGLMPLPSFGRPTAADNPRQIQFGLRVGF
ncbi:MAG TPA: carboxypeptidase regulatory-like domain-containing protein, partial [Blastocatellia bacterium]